METNTNAHANKLASFLSGEKTADAVAENFIQDAEATANAVANQPQPAREAEAHLSDESVGFTNSEDRSFYNTDRVSLPLDPVIGEAPARVGNSYLEDFQDYVNPIPSTDYMGLERFDVRILDRAWRLENLYYVVNEDGQLVKFKLREAQKWLLKNMHWKNVILKARQLGFTTFICLFLLDYALFNRNKNIGIIAHTQKDATVIFRKIKVAWENMLPELKEFLGLTTTGDSKSEYEFSNGSFMMISTSLRSGTYQAVLITEFGKLCAQFPEKAEEIITGTLPAANKGLVFIESTAEGEDGHFYDICMDAMELQQSGRQLTVKDFKFFFFPWYQNLANQVEGEVPIDQDTEVYLKKLESDLHIMLPQTFKNWYFLEKKTQKGKMQQEHPSTPTEAFISSGNKMFNGVKVEQMLNTWVRKPMRTDGDFLFYKEYVRGHLYGCGADVSQGVKKDSSTIVVIDYTTKEVVLTYKSNTIDPVSFAHDIKKACIWYGGCIAIPEANNVGLTTCVTLAGIYDNVYTQMREGLTEVQVTQKLGWLTTIGTKPIMMNELSAAFDDEDLYIPDQGILLEAKKFNKEDALQVTVGPTTTRHFDLLTGCAIAWQGRKYATRGQLDPQQEAAIEQRRAKMRNPNKLNTFR